MLLWTSELESNYESRSLNLELDLRFGVCAAISSNAMSEDHEQNSEIPRRLMPTASVARDLYLRSGNRCAYPGCDQALMTADEVLVGRIAHIEAALPGGPRFRASMTNEERRSFENLLLMCGTHHDVIDADLQTLASRPLARSQETTRGELHGSR